MGSARMNLIIPAVCGRRSLLIETIMVIYTVPTTVVVSIGQLRLLRSLLAFV
jgi:hypothetical protein